MAARRARPGQSSAASSRSSSARTGCGSASNGSGSGSFWRRVSAGGSGDGLRLRGVIVGGGRRQLGFVPRRRLGFVRAFRERLAAQLAQLLEAAGQLAALLGLVAADGVEALEVEGGQRIGLLPFEAGLGRAQLRGGVEQGHLDPLGTLALPERDRHALDQPGLDLGLGAALGHEAGRQLLQLGGGFVLQHEMLQGGEAVFQGVAGGAGLAFGGDRAAGAGAVAAGGFDLGGAAGAWCGGWHGAGVRFGFREHSMRRLEFLDPADLRPMDERTPRTSKHDDLCCPSCIARLGHQAGVSGHQRGQLQFGQAMGAAKIVHDDDVAGIERRSQHLLDVGEESGTGHRPVQHARYRHAAQPQTGNEGRGLPVPVRDGGTTPLAFGRSAVAPRHLGRGAGLIDEDQALRLKVDLPFEPRLPLCVDPRALLLGGVRGLF